MRNKILSVFEKPTPKFKANKTPSKFIYYTDTLTMESKLVNEKNIRKLLVIQLDEVLLQLKLSQTGKR